MLRSVTPGQQIVKIFQDELTTFLGGDAAPLNLDKPARILLVGLNGPGKTTSSAKFVRWLATQGRPPLLIAICTVPPPSPSSPPSESRSRCPSFSPRRTRRMFSASDELEII